MTETVTERMAALTTHETRFVFESFDHAAAWQLGTQMAERALREDLRVIIDIRRPAWSSSAQLSSGRLRRMKPGWTARPTPFSGTRQVPRCWPPGSLLRASTQSRQSGSTPPRLRRPAVPSRSGSAESGSLRP
jgi:hypothetical protein